MMRPPGTASLLDNIRGFVGPSSASESSRTGLAKGAISMTTKSKPRSRAASDVPHDATKLTSSTAGARKNEDELAASQESAANATAQQRDCISEVVQAKFDGFLQRDMEAAMSGMSVTKEGRSSSGKVAVVAERRRARANGSPYQRASAKIADATATTGASGSREGIS
ncbi:unnamed protein product [Phaeothamnion confervicola]